jgi:hypothetical protein
MSEDDAMAQIILNQEQLKAVQEATGVVEIRDDRGNLLGYMTPRATQEQIAEAKRRLNSDGPWRTTQEVLNHLSALEQG